MIIRKSWNKKLATFNFQIYFKQFNIISWISIFYLYIPIALEGSNWSTKKDVAISTTSASSIISPAMSKSKKKHDYVFSVVSRCGNMYYNAINIYILIQKHTLDIILIDIYTAGIYKMKQTV